MLMKRGYIQFFFTKTDYVGYTFVIWETINGIFSGDPPCIENRFAKFLETLFFKFVENMQFV
jgi:hypothetical protein